MTLFTSIAHTHEFESHGHGLKLPDNLKEFGSLHGEIAIDQTGLIYLSVNGGKKSGVQIYSKDGQYLRNLKNAPNDFHGFVIHLENGQEFLYGSRMTAGSILKMDLNGTILMTIPSSKIPSQYKGKKGFKLTSVDVGPNGDIYVVDGYGLDHIHQFNHKGDYLKTFGGRVAPWNFLNCHKIFIDPRFEPARILCCDRKNNRLVHLNLNGDLIGTYAENLRRPSAVDFYQDHIAIAEIYGRVTVLDKSGKVVTTVSDNEKIKGGNNWPQSSWTDGLVITPHGICYDLEGNLLISEFNRFGRTLKYKMK